MMSASAISAQIRAKKKKMETEGNTAVNLSGAHEDAIDALVNKNHEEGEELSENARTEAPEDVSPADAPAPGDDEKENRKAKLRLRMAK